MRNGTWLSGRGESDVSAREAEAGVRRGGDGRKLLLRHEVRAHFSGRKQIRHCYLSTSHIPATSRTMAITTLTSPRVR